MACPVLEQTWNWQVIEVLFVSFAPGILSKIRAGGNPMIMYVVKVSGL